MDTSKQMGWLSVLLGILTIVAFGASQGNVIVPLKWAIFLGTIVMTVMLRKDRDEDDFTYVIPMFMVILWNPIFHVPMTREVWAIFNGLATIFFAMQVLIRFGKQRRVIEDEK